MCAPGRRRNDAAAIAYGVTDLEPDNAESAVRPGSAGAERGDAERAIVLLDVPCPAARPCIRLPGAGARLSGYGSSHFSAAAGEAVKLDPASPPAHFLLGSALLEMGDAVGARSALEKAVALAPWSRDAQLNFATACVRLKQHETAIGALREAVRIRPNDVKSLARLGRLLGGVGRHAEALPYLRRAIALAPQEGRVHLALVAVLSLAQDVEATAAACDEALRDSRRIWRDYGSTTAITRRRWAGSTRPRLAFARRSRWIPTSPKRVSRKPCSANRAAIRTSRGCAGWSDSARDQDERVGAGFVLGDLLDRAGDYDAAWRAYDGANGLARSSLQLRPGGDDIRLIMIDGSRRRSPSSRRRISQPLPVWAEHPRYPFSSSDCRGRVPPWWSRSRAVIRWFSALGS